VSGIAELLDRFMTALSSVTRMPVSLLFGRSVAGLNATGESDTRNFYDAVKQDQEHKLRGVLEKLIRYIFISKDGPTDGVEPDEWSLQFTPLWQNTAEEEALTHKIVAETDAIYLDRGVLDATEVAISRFGGNTWSANTEIDIGLRERSAPEESEEVEKEKENLHEVGVKQGPDYMGTGLPRSPAASF
jgi:uncharacterized protein